MSTPPCDGPFRVRVPVPAEPAVIRVPLEGDPGPAGPPGPSGPPGPLGPPGPAGPSALDLDIPSLVLLFENGLV